MPDDLLRHVIGPTPYSSLWLWLAIALSVLLVGWYAGVFLFTMPRRRLGSVPLVGAARDRMIRYRAARTVRAIGDRYRAGEVSAGAWRSRQSRSASIPAPGDRCPRGVHTLDGIERSEIAPAAPLLTNLVDIRFNPESALDVGLVEVGTPKELIRSWA